MANDQNTTGYATTCPTHLEVWRKNAARQEADDRFTVLFDECVTAYLAIDVLDSDPGKGHYADGLIKAYSLITGDPTQVVLRQVAKAAEDKEDEAVAHTGTVTVPS